MFSHFRNVSCVKQVPLVFVIMSGRRKAHYAAVFTELQQHLATPPVRLVLDFETGMWEAARDTEFLNTTQLQGCLFHFTQCIWRQIQDLGMRQSYISDEGTRLVRLYVILVKRSNVCYNNAYII